MIAIVPEPPLAGRLYAVLIWDGEYPLGSPLGFWEYPGDAVPFCCPEYPMGAAPARAGRISKSGCAVQSLVVVVFAVNAIAGMPIARISMVKTMRALALFRCNLNNVPCSFQKQMMVVSSKTLK